MADKVVSVALQAKVQGFVSGMSKAKASVDDLTKAASPSKADAFKKLGDKGALMGVGIAAGLGVAVKRFADFDQAMSAVRANSGATGASLEALRQAAITMGADSQFSASEAAQGINEMAKAGVAAKDILGGGLKGALDLAAAGQISVADAAETAATAMTVFKLSGDKIPHVADLLANASNKAQGGVGDMSAALKQAGLVAAGMGLSIEETTAGLTAFANAGLLGSDAGTAFKTMLQRLAAPVGEAKSLMDDLNINAYDSAGNFVGLANVAEQLKTSMQDMTPAQRAAAQSVIFGSDAVRAANVLYEQGADGINRWTKEVSEQGAAAKQAATLTDNLKGDIERLGGALDSVFINTGSGANGSLRGLTQGITGLVNEVGEIPGPVLLAGGSLTALALGLPKGILAWRAYQAQLTSVGLSLDAIAVKAPRAAAAARSVGAVGVAVGALAVSGNAMENVWNDVLGASDDATKSLEAYIASGREAEGVTKLMKHGFDDLGGSFDDAFDTGFFASVSEGLSEVGTAFGLFGGTKGDDAALFFKQVDAGLAGLVEGGRTEVAAEQFRKIAAAAQDQGYSFAQVKSALPGYAAALDTASAAAAAAEAPQSAMAVATEKIQQSADDAKKALDNLRTSIEGLGSPLAAQRAAERDFQQAIDDSAERLEKRKELQKELADAEKEPAKTAADRKAKAADIARITAELEKYSKGFDVNTEAGRANQAALDNIRDTTLKNVTATFESTGSVDKATAAMQRGHDAFVEAATAAGMAGDEAEALATNLGLVPKDVTILVKQSGANAANEAIDQAARDRVALITVQTRIADFKAKQASDAGEYPVKVKKAQGGIIPGYSPTATSDNILAAVTAGEYVVRKASVDQLGKATLDYLNRFGRLPGYAAGGMVGAAQSARPVPASMAPVRGVSEGMGRMFMSGSVDMGNGLTGFVRAIVRDENDQRERSTNMRRVG
jgi:TP901 family phage tail tape measure protein